MNARDIAKKWMGIAIGLSRSKVISLEQLAAEDTARIEMMDDFEAIAAAEEEDMTPPATAADFSHLVNDKASNIKPRDCKTCGTTFTPDQSRRAYCDPCQASRGTKPLGATPTAPLQPATCGLCSHEFMPAIAGQLNCRACIKKAIGEDRPEWKPRKYVACADGCVYAKPNKDAYSGFECTAFKHNQCVPIGPAKFFKAADAQTSPNNQS